MAVLYIVGRIPAFQSDGRGSIPSLDKDFNIYPGTGCVSFVYVLFYVVSGGGPDILLTADSGISALVLLSSVFAVGYLTTAMYYSYSQRPSPSRRIWFGLYRVIQ